MKWTAILLAVPLLGGCGSLPRDQAGTLDRVRSEKLLRVGVVATAAPPHHGDKLQALIERVSQESGARVEYLEEAYPEPALLPAEPQRAGKRRTTPSQYLPRPSPDVCWLSPSS